jgi:hypothetical protein
MSRLSRLVPVGLAAALLVAAAPALGFDAAREAANFSKIKDVSSTSR